MIFKILDHIEQTWPYFFHLVMFCRNFSRFGATLTSVVKHRTCYQSATRLIEFTFFHRPNYTELGGAAWRVGLLPSFYQVRPFRRNIAKKCYLPTFVDETCGLNLIRIPCLITPHSRKGLESEEGDRGGGGVGGGVVVAPSAPRSVMCAASRRL